MSSDLLQEIDYYLDEGAGYLDAPHLGAHVLDLTDQTVRRFMVYQVEHYYTAHVLWMAHTRLMDCWEKTPRLLFLSPEPSCGKTTAMDLTECFVPRPKHLARLTQGGFYQGIADGRDLYGGRPTILHDELDAVYGNPRRGPRHNDLLTTALNAGHGRTEKFGLKIGKHLKEYELFAPVALAGYTTLEYIPDALRTRSVIVELQRAKLHEQPERWYERTTPAELAPAAWALAYWTELVHPYAFDYLRPGQPWVPEGIYGRDLDVWEPLLAVAELAGGQWPERARVACVALVALAGVGSEASFGIDLLADIKAVFDKLLVTKIFTMGPTGLLEELGKLDKRWRRLDGRRLATLLRADGVTKTHSDVRIGAEHRKGYQREWLEDAWARYLAPRATGATWATSQVSGATEEGDSDE